MQGKKILFTIHNLSAGCNSFHNVISLYSKDLWPLAVRKSGMFNNINFRVPDCPCQDSRSFYELRCEVRWSIAIMHLNTKNSKLKVN